MKATDFSMKKHFVRDAQLAEWKIFLYRRERVIAEYTHPNGKTGKVSTERAVVFDKISDYEVKTMYLHIQ